MTADEEFDDFVVEAQRRLRRGLVAAVGTERVDDAVAEALAYLVEHRDRVMFMENPIGYLFRVGQTRAHPRKRPTLPRVEPATIPDVEPLLAPALMALPDTQRTAVWLAHACSWSHAEIAEVLKVSPSTVATHISRGLARLRQELGAQDD